MLEGGGGRGDSCWGLSYVVRESQRRRRKKGSAGGFPRDFVSLAQQILSPVSGDGTFIFVPDDSEGLRGDFY